MTIPEIKHEFMAFRNGIVADTLRKAGDPHPVIFGLQLPQLGEIARKIGKDGALAEQLWNDRNVRESRLLAPYLFDVKELTQQRAIAMLANCRTREEVDLLVFRLIRFHPQLRDIRTSVEETATGNSAFPHAGYALIAIDRFADRQGNC